MVELSGHAHGDRNSPQLDTASCDGPRLVRRTAADPSPVLETQPCSYTGTDIIREFLCL